MNDSNSYPGLPLSRLSSAPAPSSSEASPSKFHIVLKTGFKSKPRHEPPKSKDEATKWIHEVAPKCLQRPGAEMYCYITGGPQRPKTCTHDLELNDVKTSLNQSFGAFQVEALSQSRPGDGRSACSKIWQSTRIPACDMEKHLEKILPSESFEGDFQLVWIRNALRDQVKTTNSKLRKATQISVECLTADTMPSFDYHMTFIQPEYASHHTAHHPSKAHGTHGGQPQAGQAVSFTRGEPRQQYPPQGAQQQSLGYNGRQRPLSTHIRSHGNQSATNIAHNQQSVVPGTLQPLARPLPICLSSGGHSPLPAVAQRSSLTQQSPGYGSPDTWTSQSQATLFVPEQSKTQPQPLNSSPSHFPVYNHMLRTSVNSGYTTQSTTGQNPNLIFSSILQPDIPPLGPRKTPLESSSPANWPPPLAEDCDGRASSFFHQSQLPSRVSGGDSKDKSSLLSKLVQDSTPDNPQGGMVGGGKLPSTQHDRQNTDY